MYKSRMVPPGLLGWQDAVGMVQWLEACDNECPLYQVCVLLPQWTRQHLALSRCSVICKNRQKFTKTDSITTDTLFLLSWWIFHGHCGQGSVSQKFSNENMSDLQRHTANGPTESRDVAYWTPPKLCLFWHTTYLLLHFCINIAMSANVLLLYQ